MLLGSGIALLSIYGFALLAGKISSKAALADFEARATRHSQTSADRRAATKVDFSRWDGGRIHGYLKSLTLNKKPAIGILRIQRLGIEVPIFEGTDSLTLNRGVGHIKGTAAAGSSGNAGIAGHRDGFFRGLKDIVIGDKIELLSPTGAVRYEVQETSVVPPSDTGVLADRGTPTLTLVTCFPFYLVGDAKQRFIVRATPAKTQDSAASGRVEPEQLTSNTRTQGE
jgi:sortase A